MLRDTVARFVEREITPRAALWDEEETFPSDVFRAMGDLGLFGISIPEAYGGSGADFLSCVLAMEEISKGDHWVLDGSKMFITNGPLADVVIVYAKTDPEAGPKGITTFLVEDGFPGFIKGKKLKKMGPAAQRPGNWSSKTVSSRTRTSWVTSTKASRF